MTEPLPLPLFQRVLPLVLVAALMLGGFGWGLAGERIPAKGGLGYDGAEVYAPLAASFVTASRYMTRERIQRALPSLVLHVALRAVGAHDQGPGPIVLAFAALNLALLGLGLWLWHQVAEALALGLRARWLAAGALFVSFAWLKMPFYDPVLTDTAGFVLAIGALLAFLRGRQAALALVLLLAAFTWPTLTWSGALLLAFPRRPGAHAPRLTPPALALALLGAAGLTALAAHNALGYVPGSGSAAELPVHRGALPASLAGLAAWLYLATSRLLAAPTLLRPAAVLAHASWTGLAVAAAGLACWQLLIASTGLPGGRSVVELMLLAPDSALTRSVRLPLLFVVAHAVYFGPGVLLAIARGRDVCAAAWSHGPGLTAFLLLGAVSAITTESRHLLHVLPFVVALTASAADRRGVGRVELGVVLGLGLVASRAWLPLGGADGDTERALAAFLAHMGPWMLLPTYVPAAAACVAVLAALRVAGRQVGGEAEADDTRPA